MVFGQYAQYYDVIYKNKDYKQECAYVQQLFRKHAHKEIKTILDLGCGTAGHIIPFIDEGYKIVGVDASTQMLKYAEQKLENLELKAELIKGKMQSIQLNRKFDAVLCLFSSIDYLTNKKDLMSMLENTAQHMKKSSLFIFDFWNENAISSHYSPSKKGLFKSNGNMVERRSTTKIYASKRLCEVNYTCSLKRNGRHTKLDKEKHLLRYFGVDEMKNYLKTAGLGVIDVHPYLNISGKIKKNTWDITMVAQKL